MKKLLFMMFLLGGISLGFASCGGGEEEAEGDTTESAEGGEHEEDAH
jgi:hypothetical protein